MKTIIIVVIVLISSLSCNAQDKISPIKDETVTHITIGYKLISGTQEKIILKNDYNPFILEDLPYDTTQQRWKQSILSGIYNYDVSNVDKTKLKKITNPISTDKLKNPSYKTISTYCNAKINQDFLVLNYTRSIDAEYDNKIKQTYLAGRISIFNAASKLVFELHDERVGFGTSFINSSKSHLTFNSVGNNDTKEIKAFEIYSLKTDKKIVSMSNPAGLDLSIIQAHSDFFIYPYMNASSIVRVLLFDTKNEKMYEYKIVKNQNITEVRFTDKKMQLYAEKETDMVLQSEVSVNSMIELRLKK